MGNDTEYHVVFSSKAMHEISKSWNWYEDIQKGLGDRFLEKVMMLVSRIKRNPFYYSVKVKTFREAILKPFPFLIIYKVDEIERIVRILSVFHSSRNPDKKHKS